MKCYYMDIRCFEDPDLFERSYAALSFPQRKEAVMRCKRTEDRMRSLGAGYLLDHALSVFTGSASHSFSLTQDQHGKPYVEHVPGFCFNLSHSGNFAALAVDLFPCGVDVEKRRLHYQNIVKRFYTEEEQNDISSAADPGEEFLRIWTRKESFLKYTGEGLSRDLGSFSVLSGLPKNTVFYEKVLPNHILTVCFCSNPSPFEKKRTFEGFEEVFPYETEKYS